MAETVDLTALHEAGHAVAARILGVGVVSAVAGDDPRVKTRLRPATTASDDMAQNQLLILVDLAGAASEFALRLREVWQADEEHALRRALGVCILRRGLGRDAKVTAEIREEAAELVEELRAKAQQLVESNQAGILRVAEALGNGATLDGDQVDQLMRLEQ
jgi:hypothetical protein